MFGIKGDGRREEEGGVRRKGARRGSKMRPLKQKVHQKCDPLNRKSSFGMEMSRPQGPPLPGRVKRRLC